MNNLRKLREEMGITQKELAEKINTSRRVIASYENGRVMLLKTREKFAVVFGCTPDEVSDEKPKRNSSCGFKINKQSSLYWENK